MPNLVCSSCGRSYPPGLAIQRCSDCWQPVEVHGDFSAAHVGSGGPLLVRYQGFLGLQKVDASLSLGEGSTPLVKARALGIFMRMPALYFKLEGHNPTGSFKDRGSVAGVQRALELGFRQVGTVSTGNMAASVAAYAARAELPCVVLVSASIPPEKLWPVAAHAPKLVQVEGDYADLYHHSLRLGPDLGIYFINSDDPFRIEGQKTLAFELMQQMPGGAPDYVFLPTSSGGHLSALIKGFREWHAAGLADSLPKLVGVQPEGCSPIVRAFAAGRQTVERFPSPQTVAHAIANPLPPSGDRVLGLLGGGRDGWMMAVSDREMEAAQALLAEEEGIFVQLEAAASLAGVVRAVQDKRVPRDAKVVAVLTGHGLKGVATSPRRTPAIRTTSLEGLHQVLSRPDGP